MRQYQTFKDFYPFYLSQHQNIVCRYLHLVGIFCVIGTIVASAITNQFWYVLIAPVIGYGLAWVGHFFFEKNKPATFQYPFYSLMGDWVMFFDILRNGKLKFEEIKK